MVCVFVETGAGPTKSMTRELAFCTTAGIAGLSQLKICLQIYGQVGQGRGMGEMETTVTEQQ